MPYIPYILGSKNIKEQSRSTVTYNAGFIGTTPWNSVYHNLLNNVLISLLCGSSSLNRITRAQHGAVRCQFRRELITIKVFYPQRGPKAADPD